MWKADQMFGSLRNNPLSKLSNKKILSQLIHLPYEVMLRIPKNQPEFYNVFPKRTKNKTRIVQEPKEILKLSHKILNRLLMKIETPKYLFSGKKGFNYIDNAKFHLGNDYFLKIDISDFYPSCTKEAVFRFFRRKLKMSEDLAWLITDLSTFSNRIPTGSPVSQTLAYWAYKDTFDEINYYADSLGLRFSLYVDDMVFSSKNKISNTVVPFVIRKLGEAGLRLKRRKKRGYGKSDFKLITGCIISPDCQLLVPYQLIENIFSQMNEKPDFDEYSEKEINSLIGRVQAAGQIENGLYYSLLGKLKIHKKRVTELDYLYKYGI